MYQEENKQVEGFNLNLGGKDIISTLLNILMLALIAFIIYRIVDNTTQVV